MEWNDGLFLVACQRKEAWQSYGRASAGWLQLFPRGSAPKWWKITLKMGVLSANLKENGGLQFFLLLNQAFSFGIVVWDSKLLRHIVTGASWVHFKQRKTKIGQKMSNELRPFSTGPFNCLHQINKDRNTSTLKV